MLEIIILQMIFAISFKFAIIKGIRDIFIHDFIQF